MEKLRGRVRERNAGRYDVFRIQAEEQDASGGCDKCSDGSIYAMSVSEGFLLQKGHSKI